MENKQINIIMMKYKLSIKNISDMFNIPYRTVQNWVGGVSCPPIYVINMIDEILKLSHNLMDYERDIKHFYDRLEIATDLLHDNRISEAMSIIDNI